MSCEFCEKRKTIHGDYLGDGTRTMRTNLELVFGQTDDEYHHEDGIFYHETEKEGALLGYESSSGEYCEQYVAIKYCPFCGRELGRSTE